MAKVIPFQRPAASLHPEAYSPAMKGIHWLTAAIILALLAVGWTMTSDLEAIKPIQGSLFALHKSLGVTVLLLTLVRLVWRSTHPVPPVPPTLKPWEVLGFHTVHYILYGLLILQPLAGWAMISLSSRTSLFFGLFPIPRLPFLPAFPNPDAVDDLLGDVHSAWAATLAVVLALHVGAALRHHFLIRDNVLLRMAPASLGPWLRKLRKEG